MFNKKMILMLILLTALVAGTANAGDYKLYGKLHTSLDLVNDGDNSQLRLSSNTSRFGVKGSSELNENFTFIWQFEQKLDMAKFGNQTLANRNSFVGLNGNWGTALVGIHDTPFKTLGRKMTFFYDEIGDHRTSTMGWDKRLQDIIVYASPNFDGFGFTAAYQFDQDSISAEEAATALSINAMYNKDGFLLGAALETLSKGYAFDPMDENAKSQMGIRAAAKKMWDTFGISALYQTISNYAGYDNWSANTMGFEARWQFAPKFALKGNYYFVNPYSDAEDDTGTPDVDESKVKFNQLAVGVDHNFAKNVGFYLQYAMVMNQEYSMEHLGGGWHGNVVYANEMGKDPNGFSLGTWFKF